MKRLTFAFVFAALAFTAPTHAETVNCTAITVLPYTITTQGVYCLTGHLSTGIATGNAIEIATNNVVLDLNGFKLGGLGAGPGTQANGIYANQRENITIKNGTVRGFFRGIYLLDVSPYTTSQGHIIEDIRADQNTYFGMYIFGNGNIIRNNQVVASGGTTAFGANSSVFGMYVFGTGARVLNNDVTQVTAVGTGAAYGMFLWWGAASNSVVAGNRIGNIIAAGGGSAFGIDLSSGSDYIVSDNRLTGLKTGIFFDAGTGTYMNNLVRGATTTPYSGGTPAGATNY